MHVVIPQHPRETVALTIPETARRLAISASTVRRLLDRGQLSRVTVGRSVRVLSSSVVQFAERGGVARG